jgi:O-antigen/teichoic acid export membrane protein
LQKTKQIRDFLFYLSGSLFLAIIAIIKLPVFTSQFTPLEFGLYSLVSITFSYLSIALYNWITSCIYRFYIQYKETNKLKVLISNIFCLYILSSVFLLLISLIWFYLASNYTISLLVILAFAFLFINQLFNMFLVILKLEGNARNYNLLQIAQSLFSFLLILYMIFRMDFRIEAIFVGQIIVTMVLLGLLFIQNRSMIRDLSISHLSVTEIRNYIGYGFAGFISSAGVLILISSDRYIIALFGDLSKVGIYNQIYQVGQVSIYFLVTVFFNTITPRFNKILIGYNQHYENELIEYINYYILLVLPVAFYLSMFARQVAQFLLGVEFRQGYYMIPWIIGSSFIYGLTLFNETKMKFDNNLAPVIKGVIVACILNVGLNFLLIPKLGYSWAAITTLVAYLFLFIYYYGRDDLKFLRNVLLRKTILIITVVLGLQYFIDLFIRKSMLIGLNKWFTLLEAALFFVLYTIVVFGMKLINKVQLTKPLTH